MKPTRGIDVGAKYEIYELIINMAKQGKTIIVVSSEMPEILGINEPYWCYVQWTAVWNCEYERDKPGRAFETQCKIPIRGRWMDMAKGNSKTLTAEQERKAAPAD